MARIVSELIYKLIADETDLVKGLKKAEKESDELAKKFTDTGKKLTLGLTVPIVAAGAAMIKLASDTGESLNAANVVFGKSSKTIEEWGKNAATQAGLTASEFYQASARIGASLINAGSSAEQASKQTIDLTKRAADMASIFNTSVDDALGALQAGLRGEAEPLRRFAVSLDEASIKAKAVAMGLVDAEGEATAYGKSQARLAVIMEQSSKFQGDFSNTSNQLANKTRITTAMIKDQAAELGTQLLPIVLEVITGIQGLVKQFSGLSDEQKRTILIVAGLAAAIGPALTAIGTMITTVNTLKTAMAGLSVAQGGPIALAIGGVIALGAGFVALINSAAETKARLQEIERLSKGGTADNPQESIKLVTEELDKQQKLLADMKTRSGRDDRSQAIILKSYEDQTKKVETLKTTLNTLVQAEKYRDQTAKGQGTVAANLEKEAAAKNVVISITEKASEAEKKRQSVNEKSIEIINSTKKESELLQMQIDDLKKSESSNEQNKLAAIAILEQKRLAAIETEIAAETAKNEEMSRLNVERIRAQQDQDAQALIDQAAADEAYRVAMQKKDEEDAAKEIALAKQVFNERLALANQFATSIFGIANQITKNESLALQYQYDSEKAAIEKSLMSEEEKKTKLAEMDKDLVRQKAEIARKQAIFEKAQALASITINTAKAVAELLAFPPLAIAAGVLGAAQAALVLAEPLPPVPAFANGGSFIVPEGFGNDSFPIPAAMVQSGERVTIETPEQQRSNGVTLQVGTLIADPAGLRELDRMLKKYGAVETARRGT